VQEPEASDIVHDLLAFLAEEMLRLNKEKQAIKCLTFPGKNCLKKIDSQKKPCYTLNICTDKEKIA
jgi:hypothetical protein